jgi:uncharacterized DUF497 family protein
VRRWYLKILIPLAGSTGSKTEKNGGKHRGVAVGVAVLRVAHADCEESGEEVIRIISARKAALHERKIYEEGL